LEKGVAICNAFFMDYKYLDNTSLTIREHWRNMDRIVLQPIVKKWL